MNQEQLNKELLKVIKDLTEKVRILQEQVNKHEVTIAYWVNK